MRSLSALLLLILLAHGAAAAEIKTRLMVRDIQHAEQVIAAALERQDYLEIRRQSTQLLNIADRIPPNEDNDIRIFCTMAAGNLQVLAHDLADPGSARKVVIARRQRGLYLEAMGMCEKEFDLDRPPTPNLR